jgi:AraC-like DNA-binding protein
MQHGSPWDRVQGQVFLGDEVFVERCNDALVEKGEVREIPREQRDVTRPPLTKLIMKGETKTLRDQTIYLAHAQYGYTLKEIADHLGIHYTTASKAFKRMAPHGK